MNSASRKTFGWIWVIAVNIYLFIIVITAGIVTGAILLGVDSWIAIRENVFFYLVIFCTWALCAYAVNRCALRNQRPLLSTIVLSPVIFCLEVWAITVFASKVNSADTSPTVSSPSRAVTSQNGPAVPAVRNRPAPVHPAAADGSNPGRETP
jgi:hypothetical protein